jgi:PTS system nitrogen regulatory IIA component
VNNEVTNNPDSNIADYLSPDHIAINLESGSKKRLLEQISELIGKDNPYISSNAVYQSLIAREKLGSTGVGKGVAIPHGRLKGSNVPIAAFVKLAVPIDYDAIDKEPVDLIFALLVPEDATEQHLQLLASIAELLSKPEFCNQLRNSSSIDELIETFPS